MQDNHKPLDETLDEIKLKSQKKSSSSDEGDERVDKDEPLHQTSKDEEER